MESGRQVAKKPTERYDWVPHAVNVASAVPSLLGNKRKKPKILFSRAAVQIIHHTVSE
jgi:hypothetical protein